MLDVLLHVLAHVLVPMFALGMVGATVVVAITFFHDVVEFFEKDETPQSDSKAMHS